MGKSQSLEKFRFKIRAKGRHGTHSPFVYAFVEAVLRDATKYPNCPKGMAPKQWQLLNATIDYLKPSHLICCLADYPESTKALTSLHSSLQSSENLIDISSFIQDDLMIIASPDQLAEGNIFNIWKTSGKGRLSFYLTQPHALPETMELRNLKAAPDFKMVLDFWEALLLVKSQDFKEKQFFELK